VDGLELVILVNGSGISAARSVIQAEIDKGLPRPVSFLYGVLTPGHRSFLADLEAWARAGIQVHTVIGEPTGTGWHGATGFVQDHAAAVGLVRANVGVVLVGLPVMVEQAKATYAAADAPNTHLLVNF
jgi:NAD(P)H-flavin reductase